MTGTISTTISSTYNLLVQYTTLLTTGEVSVTSGPAIAGTYVSSGFGWTVVNSGKVINTDTVFGSSSAETAIDLRGEGDHVTNDVGGVITAYGDAIYMAKTAATVVNAGSIATTGAFRDGVHLAAGGWVTNAASGSIMGGFHGIAVYGSTGTLLNSGTVGSGVRMFAGGFVSNAASASVSGGVGVYIQGGVGTVANTGSIAGIGSNGYGIELAAGGLVINATSASTTGVHRAVYIEGGAGTVVNDGNIASTSGNGVQLHLGGSVTNTSAASIIGDGYGVIVFGGAGTVVNDGSIASDGGAVGVLLEAGGSVTNAASASIIGGTHGISIGGATATVVNGGSIAGTSTNGVGVELGSGGLLVNDGSIAGWGTSGFGVFLDAGGSITNAASASISGGNDGVLIGGAAGTVVNSGSIAGADVFGSGVELGLYGGSVTNAASGWIAGTAFGIAVSFGGAVATIVNYGGVVAAGSNGTGVELGSGGLVANHGSVAAMGTGGIGVYLVAGGSVTNAASAAIAGNRFGVFLSSGGTLTNGGTIAGSKGVAVEFGGAGSNLLVVDPGADFSGAVIGGPGAHNTLELASSSSAGALHGLGSSISSFGSIAFDAGAHWFISGNTTGLGGTISGFALGDTIEVTGITATGSSYVGGVLTLTETSGSVALHLPGGFNTSDFLVHNVAAGADVSLACFVAGTRIRTERGAIAVEALRPGDHVPVVIGGKVRPIIWVGHRHVNCRRHPKPTEVWPIRLSAGAFGPGRPFRDLWLSPDHALLIDGVLIPIRYLVNGRTIRQEPRDEVTYWHVELGEHNVLYAEGVPAESYLDTGNRSAFANGGAIMDMHADFARRVWETKACAPLVLNGPRLTAVKRRLHDRVNALGHRMTRDADLRVLVNGDKVVAKWKARTLHVRVPAGPVNVRLVSRVWIPSQMLPDADDTRSLGIAISCVWMDGAKVNPNDRCFTDGWDTPEQEWRWTKGDAGIAVSCASELAVEVMMTGLYWEDEANGESNAA